MPNYDVNVSFGDALRHVQRATRIASEVIDLLPPWQRFEADKLMGELEGLVRRIKRQLTVTQRPENLTEPNTENPES